MRGTSISGGERYFIQNRYGIYATKPRDLDFMLYELFDRLCEEGHSGSLQLSVSPDGIVPLFRANKSSILKRVIVLLENAGCTPDIPKTR